MTRRLLTRFLLGTLAWSFVLGALFLCSLYSYNLFHALAELFAVAVATAVFMITWNMRKTLDNNYLLLLGIAFLFVALLDTLHTLAYEQMGVFAGFDANPPTQLWIAARAVQAATFAVAPFFLTRKLNPTLAFVSYATATILLLASILGTHVFPACFIPGEGLTVFKIAAEYTISAILIVSLWLLYRQRSFFDSQVVLLLGAAIAATILSELTFTLYTTPQGPFNLAGHMLKIVAFYLVYRAMVETALVKPMSVLFHRLKRTEHSLRKSERLVSTEVVYEDPRGQLLR